MNELRLIYQSLHRGDWREARVACRDLLEQVPDLAAAHHAVGLSFCGERAYEAAIEPLERAVAASGGEWRFVYDLAVGYVSVGRWHDAARSLQPHLAAADEEGLVLFVAASVECGDAEAALESIHCRYPAGVPASGALGVEYGRALYARGELLAAEAALVQALQASPDSTRAHDGLAMVCQQTGRSDAALGHWQACVRLSPDNGRTHLRLAMALAEKGRALESRIERTEALRLGLAAPDYSRALYLMLFDPTETGETLLTRYRGAFHHSPHVRRCSAPKRSDTQRRLRVGYLSGEFILTPAYYFITPFLANHDREAIDVCLYNTNGRTRPRPPSYLQPTDCWRDLSSASDDDILSTLDGDNLDVLVDLSGHFPDHRLTVFARRAVGVQASFPNYPSTTGCPEMDYLFTDEWTSPIGFDREYSERLWRLPSGYLVYAPPAEAPDVAPCPALRNGYTTFGVVQRVSKLTSQVWDCLAEILRRTPGSRLLLHYGEPELDDPGSGMSRFLARQVASRNVDPARLVLRGRRELREHLELFAEIDVCLDTWPYGGQTTTSESLWMGVPVVTMTGRTNVSRVSASLVARAGLPQLVANTTQSYIEIAERTALDVDSLLALRRTMRARAVDAGLTDGARLAREMEQAYFAWTDR